MADAKQHNFWDDRYYDIIRNAAFAVQTPDCRAEELISIGWKDVVRFQKEFCHPGGVFVCCKREMKKHVINSRLRRRPYAKMRKSPLIQNFTEKNFYGESRGETADFEDPKSDAFVSQIGATEDIGLALNSLKDRDKQVIKMIFFENKTHRDVAEALGLSRTRIGQIRKDVLRKMKRALVLRGNLCVA